MKKELEAVKGQLSRQQIGEV